MESVEMSAERVVRALARPGPAVARATGGSADQPPPTLPRSAGASAKAEAGRVRIPGEAVRHLLDKAEADPKIAWPFGSGRCLRTLEEER